LQGLAAGIAVGIALYAVPTRAASYPDPILNASETGPIICRSGESLKEFQQKALRSTRTDIAPVSVDGCFHLNGKFQVKVVKNDDGIVGIRIPNTDWAENSAFVLYGSLVSPDEDQRPAKRYRTNTVAVACRRTTDFTAAMDAVRELDAQWFSGNDNCKLVEKRSEISLIAASMPLSKVCIGPTTSCWPAWMPFNAFDELKAPRRVLGKGKLKVCWPHDTTPDERAEDIKMPLGLIFQDYGTVGGDILKTINVTVISAQPAVLRKTDSCVIVAANLVDDPDSKWDNPSVRTLRPDQNRRLAPVGIVSRDGSDDEDLSGYLEAVQPDAFAATAFGDSHVP
jgi:hypothetical protein